MYIKTITLYTLISPKCGICRYRVCETGYLHIPRVNSRIPYTSIFAETLYKHLCGDFVKVSLWRLFTSISAETLYKYLCGDSVQVSLRRPCMLGNQIAELLTLHYSSLNSVNQLSSRLSLHAKKTSYGIELHSFYRHAF